MVVYVCYHWHPVGGAGAPEAVFSDAKGAAEYCRSGGRYPSCPGYSGWDYVELSVDVDEKENKNTNVETEEHDDDDN